ncbi:hypothetical protein AWR27_09410 [Spirosoma montaniterrae]|uniref:DUF4249 domain-containing protein n=2 Tax=Spirosoma montaniterrae TaxID=1178516 RepID=A0A1P9WW25_9BACT|nr:hypothetical protein AWR27_09410 [Spirosoma montaniterrae]
MTKLIRLVLWLLVIAVSLAACIDPYEPDANYNLDVLVIDGFLTDLDEPQIVTLNRSRTEKLTGRFGVLPVSRAALTLLIDGQQTVAFSETAPGTYQLPTGIRGQAGRRYQLQLLLSDGTRYVSTEEVMPTAPAISRVYQRFNSASIVATNPARLLPANDFFIDTNDPAKQPNFYRWDWKAWEKQPWCRSCYQGRYQIFDDQQRLVEGCVTNFTIQGYLDYSCRTPCWEILQSTQLNLLADIYTDGRTIGGRLVGQIPYLHAGPCLVEIRQVALTKEAFMYFRQLEVQTQNAGGLADVPPNAPIGNVRNLANEREAVVGYFGATSVARVRYWLNRSANTGPPIANTLFEAQTGRIPQEDGRVAALCVPGPTRTPIKPEGWQE